MSKLKQHLQTVDWPTAFISACFAAGFVLVGWSILFNTPGGSGDFSSRRPGFDPVHRKAVDSINAHLQADEQTQMLRQIQMKLENSDHYPELSGQVHWIPSSVGDTTRVYGLPVETDSQSQKVYEDLIDRHEFNGHVSPEQKVEALVEKRRFIDRFEQEQKLEYVEAFVENARQRGLLVVLDDNLEVVGVRKIRRKPSYNGEESIRKLSNSY